TGSLTPLPEHYTKGFIQDKKTKVSTIRLDTLAEWIGVDIDLAKFDIEGSEYEVFADSKLDLSKFDNLIIEAHGRYPSDDVKMLVRNLRAKGFKITPLTKRESENIHILAEKDKSIRHK
ncbi:MAG: FkbM family methyltransferase, partial [Nitrosopumilus sp.]